MKQKTPDRRPITDILEPLTVEQFLGEHWHHSPLHLSGAKGRYGDLMDWDTLSRLLKISARDPKHIRVMRNGKKIPDALYLSNKRSLNAGALSAILSRGATIVVDYVDDLHEAAGKLADEVAALLSAHAWINLYASWGSESGLPLHADTHDVIVLQIAGQKAWQVYEPRRINPNEGDAFEAPAKEARPVWDGVLGDGDLLYIPRGWPHIATPKGVPSLHLTIGLSQPTGSDYFRWMARELDKHAAIRGPVPQTNVNSEIQAWLSSMRSLIERSLTPSSIHAFLSHEKAKELARPEFSLPGFANISPEGWKEGMSFRLASTRRLEVREDEDGSLTIAAAGRELPCPPAVGPAMGLLSSDRATTLEELDRHVDGETDQLKRILGLLVGLGLLFCETSEGRARE